MYINCECPFCIGFVSSFMCLISSSTVNRQMFSTRSVWWTAINISAYAWQRLTFEREMRSEDQDPTVTLEHIVSLCNEVDNARDVGQRMCACTSFKNHGIFYAHSKWRSQNIIGHSLKGKCMYKTRTCWIDLLKMPYFKIFPFQQLEFTFQSSPRMK